jgi:hypothetical protein
MLRIMLAYPRQYWPSENRFLTRTWGGWDEGLKPSQVYDAGRGWWKIGARAQRERYAILVCRGVVRQAIEITGWNPGGPVNGRRAFEGDILGPGHPVYEKYVGKSLMVASRNPIGYIKDEPDSAHTQHSSG